MLTMGLKTKKEVGYAEKKVYCAPNAHRLLRYYTALRRGQVIVIFHKLPSMYWQHLVRNISRRYISWSATRAQVLAQSKNERACWLSNFSAGISSLLFSHHRELHFVQKTI